MMDQGSLTGSVGAYLTGVAVTSAPWLLTTGVLMSLRIVARGHGGDDHFRAVEQMLTVIYAVTVVLSAPVHVVVSRYTADRLYEKRADRIGAPLRRALAGTLVGFAIVGVALMAVLRTGLAAGIAGTLLTVVIGSQWLMLSVGGGMSSPLTVLRAFGVGAPLSLLASVVLDRWFAFGALGYLYGFGAGQLATLVMLLHGVARAIPPDSDESARLAPAFAEYKLLAASALAYYLSIWSDKLIVYAFVGKLAASLYAAVSALAWFSVIPAFGWIYVQVETAFYRRFRAFYDAVEGGAPLGQIEERGGAVASEALRILRGAGMVQAATTAMALAGAPMLTHFVGLPLAAVTPFRFAVVGAALQVITLLEILLLYYFDLRWDALRVSMALLGFETALAVASWRAGLTPALGYALACAAACLMGGVIVRRRLSTLLLDTFQSQPFAGRL